MSTDWVARCEEYIRGAVATTNDIVERSDRCWREGLHKRQAAKERWNQLFQDILRRFTAVVWSGEDFKIEFGYLPHEEFSSAVMLRWVAKRYSAPGAYQYYYIYLAVESDIVIVGGFRHIYLGVANERSDMECSIGEALYYVLTHGGAAYYDVREGCPPL